jgi:predicted alpha/beta hydrolase family esterase
MTVNFDDYQVEKITAPILVIHAKDDPMARNAEAEKFVARTHPETAIFANGGHLITGHGDAVSVKIEEFIGQTVEHSGIKLLCGI